MKKNDIGQIIIPFGKFKYTPIEDLKTKYLDWLLAQDWFCEKFKELKDVIIEELKQRPDWVYEDL